MNPMFELLEQRQFLSAAINATLVSAPPINTANLNSEQITVDFQSRSAIRIKTIDTGDLTDDAGLAVIGVTTNSDRQHRDIVATYSIAAPAGGWTSTRDGAYSFELAAGKVRNQNGGRSTAIQGSFSVNISAPTITGVSRVLADVDQQSISISGSEFESGLTVTFRDPSGNAIDKTSEIQTPISSTLITITDSSAETIGTWTAEVVNPDGGDSGPFSFTVLPPPPQVPPVSITSISPVVAFFGHQPVTINGSGFENGLTLLFTDPSGNVTDETGEEVQRVGSTQLTASVGLVNIAGTWTAEVINPDGGDSGQFSFTVTPALPQPQPVNIASVSPVVAFFGHQSISINGSGFENGLKLLFIDPSGNVTDETGEDLEISSTQITGSISQVNPAGTWTAEVVNPDGGDSGQFSFNVT